MSRVRAPFPAPEIDKFVAGWSSLVARRAHNPEVAGSNPAPATILRGPAQGARPRSSAGSSASMVRMRSSVRFRSRAPGFEKLSARVGAGSFSRRWPAQSVMFQRPLSEFTEAPPVSQQFLNFRGSTCPIRLDSNQKEDCLLSGANHQWGNHYSRLHGGIP
jgi:hypothetical protein